MLVRSKWFGRITDYMVRLLFIGLAGILFSACVQAKEYALILDRLEKVDAQEEIDELYISVTEFAGDRSARYYQVPSYPSHWLSNHLSKVTNVILWRKPMKQCEPVELLISLVEEDVPPWNVNDLLGSIRLKVKCENGKPVKEWSIPDSTRTSKVKGKKNAFLLHGAKGEYRMTFSLKQNVQLNKNQLKQFEYNQNQTSDFKITPLF